MLDLNFAPFPELTTERLLLRRLQVTDAPAMYPMRSDPEIMKYIPRPVATCEDDVVKLINMINERGDQNESINWGITLKGDDTVIGTIGFVRLSKEDHRGELGYMLDKGAHGRGIMSEALPVVIDFGFDFCNFHTMEGIVDPANTASIRLLEQNGFIREAHFKENCYYNGRYLDSVHYSRMKR